MGRHVSSELSFQLKCGTTVFGKKDSRSKTGVSFQMTNPHYGVPKAYKSATKMLSLGSCVTKAKIKAISIIDQTITLNKTVSQKPVSKTSSSSIKNEIDKLSFMEPLEIEMKVRDNVTIKDLIDAANEHHDEQISDGSLDADSKRQYQTYYNYIRKAWNSSSLTWICTSNIHTHIKYVIRNHGTRSAQVLLSRYRQILKIAKSKGLISYKANPVTDVLKVKYRPKRARLSPDMFNKILDSYTENDKHYELLCRLLFTTKLRLEDACLFRNCKGDDWEDRVRNFRENRNYFKTRRLTFKDKIASAPYSYIDNANKTLVLFHQKTGKITQLPFVHKISDDYPSVLETIKQLQEICKFKSAFLVHHTKNIGRAKTGNPLRPEVVSRKFTKNVSLLRDALGESIKWNGSAPTLHEIKSLGVRLQEEYKKPLNLLFGCSQNSPMEFSSTISEEVNNSPRADLDDSVGAGHNNKKTTEIYTNPRFENGLLTAGMNVLLKQESPRISFTT